MNAVTKVVADPKAIAARRGNAKVVQNVGMRSERTDAKQWRREHGLDVQGPAKMKQQGFALPELLICIWMLFTICIVGGLFWVVIHFLSKIW